MLEVLVSCTKSSIFMQRLSVHFKFNSSYTNMDEPLEVSNCIKETTQNLLLQPPAEVRGMKSLNRDLFTKTIIVPALEISINESTAISKKGILKKYLLKLLNFKPVQDDSQRPVPTAEYNSIVNNSCADPDSVNSELSNYNTSKIVYLNPLIVKSYNDFEEHDREVLLSLGIMQHALKFVNLTLKYENWRADEVLKAILPEDKDSVTGFSKIGHIIHLNLRDHVMDYKHIIGEILLDKVSGAKTVVNKIDGISNAYRNFQMEIICGEHNMVASVKENSCIFEFDFSTVYWNPRLSTEHKRITDKLNEGDVLYDVFAGVGPFSIPACKRKCFVLANDLNPESYKWLQHNGKRNKVLHLLKTFNKDAIDFIKEDVKSDMLQRWNSELHVNKLMHITMNLPALAETFLSVFNGLFTSTDIDTVDVKTTPIIHFYCFTKGIGDPAALAVAKIREKLGPNFNENNILEIVDVRTVSSYKEMMRVSFRISLDILLSCPNSNKRQSTEDEHILPTKRINSCNNDNSIPRYGETEGTELSEQQEKQSKEQA